MAEPVEQNELVRVERSAFEAMPHIVEGLGAWREAVLATPRVLHVIGCLTHGGAERQLATYAAAAHARGLASHSVLTFHPAEGAGAHFRPLLESAGVRIRAFRDPPSQSALHAINTNMKLRARMAAIPPHLGVEPIDFVGALRSLLESNESSFHFALCRRRTFLRGMASGCCRGIARC